MSVDFKALLHDVNEATKAHGMDFRGKKYSPVATRLELFRRAYGDTAAIETTIIHLGMTKGEPIVMRATISIGGAIVATGTAWEVIGGSNVNQSSALENAETSAVGRALAVLGLHGGEMASANEMARIPDKPENPTAEGLLNAWEDAIMDNLPEDPAAETVARAYADAMMAEVAAYKTASGVDGYMKKHARHVHFVGKHDGEALRELRDAVTAHRHAIATVAA